MSLSKAATIAGLWLGITFGCKTAMPASEPLAAATKPLQCTPGTAFTGVCSVTEVSGRQDTTTEAARSSSLGEVSELRISVPASSSPGGDSHTHIRFAKKAGPIEDWAIDQALDLYNRQGCIAEINGGVLGDGYTPRITLRVLMNMSDEGRTAYAELSDYRTGKPTYATLTLKCDWQK